MRHVLDSLTRQRDGVRVPNILFTKGGGAVLESMAESGCDALSIDWTLDLGAVRKRIGTRVALQGNLDPAVLFGAPETIRNGAASVLEQYGAGAGHVFNLGHGVSRYTPPESVGVLVAAVHELSRAYH
jgi:uroporphyrinogen decarboxylase